MSARLTVYWIAAEAEQPDLLRRLEHARRVAEAESSAPPRAGIRRTARQWLGAGAAGDGRRRITAGPAATARPAATVRAAGEAVLPPL